LAHRPRGKLLLAYGDMDDNVHPALNPLADQRADQGGPGFRRAGAAGARRHDDTVEPVVPAAGDGVPGGASSDTVIGLPIPQKR